MVLEKQKAGKKRMKAIGNVDNISLSGNVNQLKQLNRAISALNSGDIAQFQSNVSALAGSLKELSVVPAGNMSTMSSAVKAVVNAYGKLGTMNLDFGPQIASITTAVTGLSGASASLNNVNFKEFEKNIAQLSTCLQPLQGFRSQAYSLLNALKAFPETASALNDFDGFQSFDAQVQALANSLSHLNGVNGKLGATIDALTRVTQASNSLDSVNFQQFKDQVEYLVGALSQLQTVNSKLGTTLNNLSRVGTVAQSLSVALRSTDISGDINSLARDLNGLKSINGDGLRTVINSLSKIPDLTRSLDTATINSFSDAVKTLTEALAPLSTELVAVSNGFSRLPGSANQTVNAINKLGNSAKSASTSFSSFTTSMTRAITKAGIVYYAMRRVRDVLADCFEESNDYIENLNLFTVTMGDASDSALEFAQNVSDLMGIDVSEWIENQGVFMRMATGFGVASDKAALMSKNLTQLAYDMSSFFNSDVETAMQKLQSGMSGQIKGLKAWGYNLSVAALQETALSLGITTSVRKMTEAQRAQLRYITLIQKSNGVMGDMARTLVTPANALRILSAQFVQMKRAMGDVVSVIAVQVIPYVQVLVRLLTDAAKALASFFGFELPKIDYSGLELGADYTDEVSDSLDNATSSAKELKKQLMGFDELNVLSKPKDSGSASAGVGSPDLGVELPEYDFLNGLDSKTEELTKKVKSFFSDIKDEIDRFGPVLAGLATAFSGAFAFKWLKDVLKKVASISAVAKVLTALKKAIVAAALAFKLSKNPFLAFGTAISSLWASFKAFMSGLSPFTKGIVSIVALSAEFITVSNAIRELTLGNMSLGESLMNIVPVVGAVGAAMYAMLGPIGLVATAVVGVVAAVNGFIEAENELRAQLVDTTFYDGQGTAISDLANAYGDLMQKTIDAQQPILNAWSDIESGRKGIWETANSISNLCTQVELGYVSVSENIPLIVDEFNKLYDDTVDVLNKEASLIYTALASSTGKALEDMGYNLSEVGLLISTVVGDTTKEIESLVEENKKLEESLKAGTEDDGAMTKYLENAKEIARLSGVDTSGLDEFRDKVKNLIPDDINWETDDLTGVFDSIATSTSDAKTAIEESTQATIDALEHMKSLAVKPEDIKIFDDIIAAVTADKDNKLKQIEDVAAEFVGGLQTNLLESVQEQYDAAMENWDSLSWLEKAFMYDGSKAEYVKSCLETYKSNIVDPITDQMKDSFGKTLSEDDLWAKDAMKSMLNTLFSSDAYTDVSGECYIVTTTFAKDVASALDEVLPPQMKKSGENAVAGIVEGLTSNNSSVSDAADSLGKTVLNSFDDAMDINSPSVEMAKRGGWTAEGFINGVNEKRSDIDRTMEELAAAILETVNIDTKLVESGRSMMNSLANGINGNKRAVTSALDSLSKEMTSKFNSMSSSCQSIMKNMVKNIASSVNGLNVSVKTTSTGATMKASVSGFANGGFPVAGEMFIAREAGPEMVGRIGSKTSVANNEQIVSGIASGVRDANQDMISVVYAVAAQVVSAIKENGDVYLDGEKITKKVTTNQNRQSKMYG